MRHGMAGNRLSRNSKWREATVRDLARATLTRQRITTTKAKAKEARKLVDKLITMGKKGSLAHKRRAFAILGDHKLVSALFNKIAMRFKTRNGGYTRIIGMSNRRGDNACMVLLELTERETVVVNKPKAGAAKKAKASAATGEEQTAPAKSETPGKAAKPKPIEHKKTDAKTAADKNIVGGIKKIFRRKQGE